MQINLTMSKNTAVSTSAWNGTAHEHVEYVGGLQRVYNTYTYSAPDVISDDTVTVTVPSSLSDVTFVSARLTYDVSQTQSGGSRTLQFADTGRNVTDKAILARLRAGDTSFRIKFYFRAAGGTGGSGIHYATCSWKNLQISAEYTPNSRIHGYAPAADGTNIFYGLDADNLAQGESMPVRLSFTAKKAVASVTFSVAGNAGGSGSVTVNDTASEGGAWDNTFSFTLPQTEPSLWTDRVGASADICILITYQGEGGAVSAGPVNTALKLVRERLAPSLSLSFTDTAGVYSAFGAYVQNRSVLSAAPSVTLDTGADADNAVSAMTLLFGGDTFGAADGPIEIGELTRDGTLPWTLTVTDSYGVTGTLSGTLCVTPWSPPFLAGIEPERYSSGVDTGGNPVYYPDDGGTDIRLSLTGGVSSVNGLNAWTLVMSATNGTDTYTRTLLAGADGGAISLDRDRGVYGAQLSASSDWAVTLTLADSFATSVYDGIVIPRAGAIFNIEKTGVAVGMRSTGTLAQPLFQVAYPAEFSSVSKLGGKVYDTGWVDLSQYADISKISVRDGRFHARRIGSTVHLYLGVTAKTNINASTWVAVSSAIPQEFRPGQETFVASYSQAPGGYMGVTAGGLIRLRNQTGGQTSAGFWCYTMGSYTV